MGAASDPICTICGEPKSAHVSTDKGPLTHPREARGEGVYVREDWSHGSFFPALDDQWHTRWRFVPAAKKEEG